MPQQPTVLVVEDQLGPRESLRAILQPDYRVLMALEGEHALHLCGARAGGSRAPGPPLTRALRPPRPGKTEGVQPLPRGDCRDQLWLGCDGARSGALGRLRLHTQAF